MKRTALHTFAAVTCAAVLALSVSGCGSSSDKSSDGKAKTLSASDFRSQANALCKTANAEVATIEAGADTTTTAGAQKAVDDFTARITKLVDSLKQLKPPSDLAGDVTAMLDTVSGVVAEAKKQGPAFLGATTDPFADADKKATDLGLDQCAGNTNSSSGSSSGSGSGSSTGSGTALSVDEYKVQADAICKTANDKLKTITAGVVDMNSPTAAELTKVSGLLVGYITEEIDGLKALTPPAETADDVNTWITTFSGVLDTARSEGGKFFDRSSNPFTDSNSKAQALGLQACGTTAE